MGLRDQVVAAYAVKKMVENTASKLSDSDRSAYAERKKNEFNQEQRDLRNKQKSERFLAGQKKWEENREEREKVLYPDNLTRAQKTKKGRAGKTMLERGKIQALLRFIKEGGEKPDSGMSPEDFLLQTLESRFGWEEGALELVRRNMEKSPEDFPPVSYERLEEDTNEEECGRLHTVGADPSAPGGVFTSAVSRYEKSGSAAADGRIVIDFEALIEKAEQEGYVLPGLEYLQRASQNPEAVWPQAVHGNWKYLPGTLFRSDDGRWYIFRAKWEKDQRRFSIGADAIADGVPEDATFFLSS